MHQRQAGSYARRFVFGKNQIAHVDLDRYCAEPGIGLVPPEFDDLEGAEIEQRNDFGNHEANAAE